ncbi:MAG: hypothetical protein R3300_21760, partial [Candidatus Promineifilaceae bacterium]|nr:hypothetical protein [Candidatus Promineifilaceae bacterium]
MHRPAGIALILLLLLGLTAPASAQEAQQAVLLSATVGFDGFYKSGYWSPVHVNLANDGAPVEGQVRITVGERVAQEPLDYVSPVSLPTRSSKRVTLYVFLPGL